MDLETVLDELAECNLTQWEEEFVESLQAWDGGLTEKQAGVLVKMCKKYLEEEYDPDEFM